VIKKILSLVALAPLALVFWACSGGPLAPDPPKPAPPPPTSTPPKVIYFSAGPAEISLGERAQLDWRVELVSNISIDNGIGVVFTAPMTPGGQSWVTEQSCYSVFPTVTTTYVLTAWNSSGSTTASCVVKVK